MKKIVIGLMGASVLAASAVAMAGGPDNMAPAAPSYHTGFYAGADLGYGGYTGDVANVMKATTKGLGLKSSFSGAVFGAHVGYDINQYFAAQLEYAYLPKIKASTDGFSQVASYNMAAIEGKVMYPVLDGKLIPFATAGYGVIFTSTKINHKTDKSFSGHIFRPVLGAGVEYKVMPKLGVYAQYKAVIGTDVNAKKTYPTAQMGLVGVNYYF